MMEASIALLFGLLIGSFLNVCIYRWPLDQSVVKPRSHCIACRKTIAWYDNIPLVSFVVLGGRCRYCQARISFRYPVVELSTGLLFFYWVFTAGLTLLAVKMCIFTGMLVALVFCDLEERILPDEFTLGGTLVGLVLAAFVPVPDAYSQALLSYIGVGPGRVSSVLESALGAGLPTLLLWGAGWLYEKVRHREGLGLGDVKLIAMVGAFLGLGGALETLIIGSVSGSILGYAYIKLTHKDASTYELPFGTFLGLAALLVAFLLVSAPPR
ncbi:MAG: prepilin peptidase [Bryobacteraceae bacterium]|jgi:leader peptidase (prepilin peptidase)/N-methyltransferase